MKLLFVVGLLSIIAVFSHAAPQCHMSELGKCLDIAINWLHSLPKRSIPETEDDINVMCTEVGKALDCKNKFIDSCTTPLQKELIPLVAEGLQEFRTQLCQSGSAGRNKYLTHSVCLNKVAHLDQIKDHIEYILATLEHAEKVPENQRITYVCCGYSKGVHGFSKLIKDNCGSEAVDAAGELIGQVVAQLPSVICNGFDSEEDKCKVILPPEGSKPSEAAKDHFLYKVIKDLLKNFLD